MSKELGTKLHLALERERRRGMIAFVIWGLSLAILPQLIVGLFWQVVTAVGLGLWLIGNLYHWNQKAMYFRAFDRIDRS